MNLFQQFRKVLVVLSLVLVVFTTSACAGSSQAASPFVDHTRSSGNSSVIERGNTVSQQQYGDWLVQTGKGLIKDAHVRDNNKIGVVITPQVRPNQVRSLAKSVVQSSHSTFPNRDLTVLVYAPDKELLLKAQYNDKTQQIEYEAPKG
jgi:hypothetical protein